MIKLAPDLDTIDFDGLLAAARAKLPALSSTWTDYNYHDPGIMLVELLAWLADSQIYSLSRNRQDEQAAMARLFGMAARGAVPATGVLVATTPPDAVERVAAGAVLKPARDAVPRVEADADIDVLPIAIDRIATILPDGHRQDHSAVNAQARARYPAFGDDGVLRIDFKRLPAPAWPSGPLQLAIGVEVDGLGPAAPPRDDGQVQARDGFGRALAQTYDSTGGFQRSGVVVLAIDPATFGDAIEFSPARNYALSPQLRRVSINALPVRQRATLQLPLYRGTDRPGQTIKVTPNALFAADEFVEDRVWRIADGPDTVTVETLPDGPVWSSGRLDPAGPDDPCYAIAEQSDGSAIRLRFGNGINGRRPALAEAIGVTLTLSCGAGGNVRHPVDWQLLGSRIAWRNLAPIEGGQDAQSTAALLAAVRDRVRTDRVLATADEIINVAMTLDPALAVARATVVEGWEPGRAVPAIPATRTLIVGHQIAERETAGWLARIRRALIPRIAIGERLLVVGPTYRTVDVAVTMRVAPGADRVDVTKRIKAMLTDRFDTAKATWPLGRDLDPEAMAGWIRQVDGVGGGVAVRLSPASGSGRVVAGPADLVRLGPVSVTTAEGAR